MRKWIVAISLAFVLLFGGVSTVFAEPYWSCHYETVYKWVGWPTFFEKHTVQVCEVREY